MAKFELDAHEVEQLEASLSKLGDEAERTINELIHELGFNILESDIARRLPIGARPNPRHAITSKPFTKNTYNLGFDFKTKGGAANNKNSFGYLIFPDEGRGKRNPRAQKFSELGIMSAKPKIMEQLLEQVTQKVQEVI